MLFFTLRRLLSAVVVLFVSSILVFALAATAADPLAKFRQLQPMPSESFFAAKRAEFGLDQPILVRYVKWLGNFLTGDFGNNLGGNPVNAELFSRLGITVSLVTAAMVIAVIMAILVGVYTAVRQYKFADHFFSVLSYLLIALPVFWFAALLKEGAISFNELVGTKVIETLYQESPGLSSYGSTGEIISDRLTHLILPTISLAALNFAGWSRFQRAATVDVLSSDFLRLARAKGLPWRVVLFRHGLRNALIPLTTVVALGVGGILGGAILTEQVFQWHGLGEYFLAAVGNGDVNQLLAWLMLSATFVILFNLIADLLYAVLDPRIRLS